MHLLVILGCVAAEPAPPPIDAGGAVIKTWGFLRSTTDSLGAQAQAVLTAKRHLEDLELDVETQRAAWKKASDALQADNVALAQQVKDRQVTPPDYAAMSAALQLQISAAKAQVEATLLEADKTRSVWQVQRQTYLQSITDLEHTQTQVQGAMAAANEQAVKEQQELDVKKADLESQVVSLKAQIQAQKDANSTETVEAGQNETSIQDQTQVLQQQAEEVASDLTKVEATAAKKAGVEADLAAGQKDLALAQEHKLQTSAACDAKTEELRSVLEAERQKVALVAEEAHKCAALEANRDVLKQQVAAACAKQ